MAPTLQHITESNFFDRWYFSETIAALCSQLMKNITSFTFKHFILVHCLQREKPPAKLSALQLSHTIALKSRIKNSIYRVSLQNK